jgi:hypothetical protein
MVGKNRIDQRMPPEPDHRLSSPSKESARSKRFKKTLLLTAEKHPVTGEPRRAQ